MIWPGRKSKQARSGADARSHSAPKDLGDHELLTATHHLSESHNGAYARTLIWTVAAALGAFLYWSALTPVYEIISGQGSIRPEAQSSRVEHLEGGQVTSIEVREGETVEPGQLLMRLSGLDLEAEQRKLLAQARQLDQSRTRFEAVLNFDLSASRELSEIMTVIASEPTFTQEIQFRLAQIRTLRTQKAVVEAQREALEGQMAGLDAEAAILTDRIARYETLQSGVISQNQREELTREKLRLSNTIAQLQGEIAIQTAMIAQMDATEEELVAEYRREASVQLEALQSEIARNRESQAQIRDRIGRTELRASIAGTIQAIAVQNVGEVIGPGEIVMEIVPTDQSHIAEVEIPADRIGGVEVGQIASLKILTYDFTRYGDIEATVERISPSSFPKEDGSNVFRVRLVFDSDAGMPAGGITPGMTVVADIKSERRTILSYLLKPVRVIADRAFTEA